MADLKMLADDIIEFVIKNKIHLDNYDDVEETLETLVSEQGRIHELKYFEEEVLKELVVDRFFEEQKKAIKELRKMYKESS